MDDTFTHILEDDGMAHRILAHLVEDLLDFCNKTCAEARPLFIVPICSDIEFNARFAAKVDR